MYTFKVKVIFFFSVHHRSALRTPGSQTPGSSFPHHTVDVKAQIQQSTRVNDGSRVSSNSKKLYSDYGHYKCDTMAVLSAVINTNVSYLDFGHRYSFIRS